MFTKSYPHVQYSRKNKLAVYHEAEVYLQTRQCHSELYFLVWLLWSKVDSEAGNAFFFLA